MYVLTDRAKERKTWVIWHIPSGDFLCDGGSKEEAWKEELNSAWVKEALLERGYHEVQQEYFDTLGVYSPEEILEAAKDGYTWPFDLRLVKEAWVEKESYFSWWAAQKFKHYRKLGVEHVVNLASYLISNRCFTPEGLDALSDCVYYQRVVEQHGNLAFIAALLLDAYRGGDNMYKAVNDVLEEMNREVVYRSDPGYILYLCLAYQARGGDDEYGLSWIARDLVDRVMRVILFETDEHMREDMYHNPVIDFRAIFDEMDVVD